MEPLVGLKVAPLNLCLRTTGPFRTPEYKGALFRGGFGHFFRDMVCATGAPACAACPRLQECPYSLVFETPVIAERFEVLRKYPNAPHPFVLRPPLDVRTSVPPGTPLTLGLTLIGRGVDYLPHFIAVFEAMGRSGRYGGYFQIEAVISAVAEGVVVYDGAARRMGAAPPVWTPVPEREPLECARLEFVTPLRIRTDGRYNLRPDFVAVTHALLRRVHLLAAIYGAGNGDAAWMHPLLAAADRAVTQRADWTLFPWSRTSGRQQRRVEMDGVVGRLEARGDLTALAPYLRAGEWLHVGSGTSMGMGGYSLGELC